jgi:DNA polymerase-3 subunit epsilon
MRVYSLTKISFRAVMNTFWFRLRGFYYSQKLRRKHLPSLAQSNLHLFKRLSFKTSLAETDFVVFDTETTGLYAGKGDRILSLSGVRIRQGRIDLSDTFHELVNPNRDIPPQTATLHEILPRMVAGKPAFEEVLPGFVGYIGASSLVAHHAWLDMTFLNREMIRLFGFPIQNPVLDTAVLGRALLAGKRRFVHSIPEQDSGLSALATRYQVRIDDRHSSFGDTLATAQIFQKMIKEAQQLGILSLKDLLRLSSRHRGDHLLPRQGSF